MLFNFGQKTHQSSKALKIAGKFLAVPARPPLQPLRGGLAMEKKFYNLNNVAFFQEIFFEINQNLI